VITLEQVRKELDVHFARIDALLPELKSYLPLSEEDFSDTEKIKTIDAFIYRFTKVQDRMGEKFFPLILQNLYEYKSNMALIDVLNRLEKLELLDSADRWIEYRKLRNTLTHEYTDNEDEIIAAINMSIDAYEAMKKIYYRMLERA
jgi:hypothetical protein